jgi:glycosyltransferase involved in cell wall biosynthesis
VRAGVELTLVVPTVWPCPDELTDEPFDVVQLPVRRPGDVNRHRFVDPSAITDLVTRLRPEVVDLHEEPFSRVVHQVLKTLPADQAVVAYAAQNIDKRFPPPFAQWERQALARVHGIYPCTEQAASVVVGKGFTGAVRVLPLGLPSAITTGNQVLPADVVRLLLVGRLVPEKGVLAAARVLAQLRSAAPAVLTIVGDGPEGPAALELASTLGVREQVRLESWLDAAGLAERYRQAHVLLAPSRTTRTWVEQFGRMVVEAQAAGAVVAGYMSGSLPEVVGAAGVLVAEGDVDALAAAVTELVKEPARWLTLRAAGLDAAGGRSWDAVAAGQVELYRQAIELPSNRGPVRPNRRAAEARYGPPARVHGAGRPFALPVLREDNQVTRTLARALDTMSRRPRPEPVTRTRVVYLDHVGRLSGGELALSRLIAALPDVDAHVILAEDGPLRSTLEEHGATVEILPLDPAARDVRRADVIAGAGSVRVAVTMVAYTLRLARRLRALEPDLVHTNSLKSGYYGSVAARLARRPVIWHLRDRIADDYLPHRAVVLTRFALRHLPDLVLCNSAETLRTSSVTSSSAAVVGSPVVHDPYQPVSVESLWRATPVIGMVGRLSPWKGQDIFLRAFASAFADRPDVHARIVGSAMFGEDEYAAQLRALVNDLGLDERVTLVGFTDRVEQELAGMDVLVHASTAPEPFGQVIVEGMAAGLAVIATRAGGPVEIITDGVDGILVTPGDPAALAAALTQTVGDPDLRARLGAAAMTRARDFSPEIIGQEVREIYRQVLAQHPRRARRGSG